MRIWHDVMIKKLKSFELNELKAAPCTFMDKNMIVEYSVDDILIFKSKREAADKLKRFLESERKR